MSFTTRNIIELGKEEKMNKERFDELKPEVFSFLDNLRESGITNMYGAVPYIMEEFEEVKEGDAREYLHQWMGGKIC